MLSLSRKLQKIGYDAKYYFGSHPMLYWAFYFYRDTAANWVTRKTVICMEGFPRSGNTFGVGLFRLSTGIDGGLAWPGIKRDRQIYGLTRHRLICSHTHVAMQIVRAARLGVPCIAAIRDPISTLTSWLLARNGLRPDDAVKHYVWYYRCVRDVADEVVVADFPTITSDFRKIIERVNSRYGTQFKCLETTDEVRALLFERMRERHDYLKQPESLLTIPSEERERLKKPVQEQLKACGQIQEAWALYADLQRRAV